MQPYELPYPKVNAIWWDFFLNVFISNMKREKEMMNLCAKIIPIRLYFYYIPCNYQAEQWIYVYVCVRTYICMHICVCSYIFTKHIKVSLWEVICSNYWMAVIAPHQMWGFVFLSGTYLDYISNAFWQWNAVLWLSFGQCYLCRQTCCGASRTCHKISCTFPTLSWLMG